MNTCWKFWQCDYSSAISSFRRSHLVCTRLHQRAPVYTGAAPRYTRVPLAPMALVCTAALQHATHAAHEFPCTLVCTSALHYVTRVHLSTALCHSCVPQRCIMSLVCTSALRYVTRVYLSAALCHSCVPQRCIMSHMVHMSALAHSCALQRFIMSRRLEQKTVTVELYTHTHTHKRAHTHTHKCMH